MSDTSFVPLTLICAGSSLAVSSLFYHLYQRKKTEIDMLKKIPLFKPDDYLLKILKASPQKRLHYVALEGLVQADGEPLASQYVPRCFGVVQRITAEEHWKIWNHSLGSWVSKRSNRTETNNTVAFSLVQPGLYTHGLSVKVQSPQEASGDYLEEVHQSLKHAQEGLVDILIQGVSGEKPVAREEREEMLCVGTTLTGFGEVVLEYDGVMRLQPPKDGRQFVLIPGDHRSFMVRHESSATMWKSLTALFGITGSSLLAGLIYSSFTQKDGKRQ